MQNTSHKPKLCIVSSRGGHLYQLLLLKPWWNQYPRIWITGKGEDADYLLKNETVYYGHFPETRNARNAIRNFFVGLKVLYKEKPQIVVSCGAGIAPPVFLAARLLGLRLLFIDSISFVNYPSLSARIISHLKGTVLVQHKHMVTSLRNAHYWGGIL